MSVMLRFRPPGASTSARFQAYRAEEAGLGRFLMQRLIDSLKQAVPNGLEEIQAPGKNPDRKSPDTRRGLFTASVEGSVTCADIGVG